MFNIWQNIWPQGPQWLQEATLLKDKLSKKQNGDSHTEKNLHIQNAPMEWQTV